MKILATDAQLQYIEVLCERLGYDCSAYIDDNLTKEQASHIIKKLKDEYEGGITALQGIATIPQIGKIEKLCKEMNIPFDKENYYTCSKEDAHRTIQSLMRKQKKRAKNEVHKV